jgi:cell division protein FtsX
MKSRLEDILGLPPIEPLLPKRAETDRPLLIVLAIMAFLATLALLAGRQGLRLGTDWQSELYGTASLQVFDVAPENHDIIIRRVTERLDSFTPPLQITLLSQADMTSRLEPWLGPNGQTDDLPFPLFFSLESERDILPNQIENWLAPLELNLLIDNHAVWRGEFESVGRALYRTALLVLLLVLAASAVIAGFATQSVMSAFAPTLKIIYRSGASRPYVAQLFTKRIFKLSLRGAIIGVFGGVLVALLWNGLILGTGDSLMQRLSLRVSDLIWIAGLIIFFVSCCTAVTGFIAWRAPSKKHNIR